MPGSSGWLTSPRFHAPTACLVVRTQALLKASWAAAHVWPLFCWVACGQGRTAG